ncbi:MAG: transglycosylase domain-containing protein [Anaerolineales bacterium]|jgi:membrane peptidoglycan carboxypeptidase|nr:transglycosylase domain-containing protein [Anaerolineales bacterium]
MVDVPLILRARRRRRRTSSHAKHVPRLGKTAALGTSLLLLGVVIAGIWAYFNLMQGLPSLERLPVLVSEQNGLFRFPTTLYDRTGTQVVSILQDPAALDRQYLRLQGDPEASFPLPLVDATLATADPDFWNHPGYLLNDWDPHSHPTLAQKLAIELLLSEESPSLRRSLRERLLAGQITQRYGREQILEWYLNSAQYGKLITGADAAARVYFGKSAVQLSLAESAALAAIQQLPGVNPTQAPQLIEEKKNLVLRTMLEGGWITASQEEEAASQELVFIPQVEKAELAPALVELVMQQLDPVVPRTLLERGGYRIITTLDFDLQTQVRCTASALSMRFSNPEAVVRESTSLDEACPAARLLPTLTQAGAAQIIDLQSAVVILDPQTGQILSLEGGALLASPASAPDRPAGTLALPFLYLNAFTRGFSPATLAWDIPTASAPAFDVDYHGPVRLRTALVNDYLATAHQMISQLGLETTLTTARQLGAFPVDDNPALSAAAGQSLLERFLSEPAGLLGMAQAFATLDYQGLSAGQAVLANGTTTLQPYSVLRLEDAHQQVILDWTQPVAQTVLSPQLSYLINHSLSDEVARWNSLGHPNLFEIGRPVAAKAGQTLDQQDAWAVGYTPQRLVGVWLGKLDQASSTAIPSQAPAALWRALIQYASRDLQVMGWTAPPGISEVEVCDPSGLLPTAYCPQTAVEVFLTGSEPTQADNLFQSFQINRQSGRLATVFTQPELVEEKVFLVVPSEASGWAAQAGLPMPPKDYDLVSSPPASKPSVVINAPELFSHVRGKVPLIGTAKGDGFQFFRLYYGQGLNPQQWIQIGTDGNVPVEAGTLGVWDTEGLNGLYALQLQVVSQEQRVENALIQVTVDNTAPQVSLLTPSAGAIYNLESQLEIVFQAAAADNLELAQVTFLLDGKRVNTLVEPPYLVVWAARLGIHTLTVNAIDLAGNQASIQVSFTVK